MWKKLLLEMKKVHLEKCIGYLANKQNKATFCPRLPMRRKGALELVHLDVCYVDAKSHVGAWYSVMFIDNYIWKFWASVLKAKDQVLSVFKEFQARAERESKQKLKVVKTDNRSEYHGQFEEYC